MLLTRPFFHSSQMEHRYSCYGEEAHGKCTCHIKSLEICARRDFRCLCDLIPIGKKSQCKLFGSFRAYRFLRIRLLCFSSLLHSSEIQYFMEKHKVDVGEYSLPAHFSAELKKIPLPLSYIDFAKILYDDVLPSFIYTELWSYKVTCRFWHTPFVRLLMSFHFWLPLFLSCRLISTIKFIVFALHLYCLHWLSLLYLDPKSPVWIDNSFQFPEEEFIYLILSFWNYR